MTASEWLYQKLSAILPAYYEAAPESAAYPFFVFRMNEAENVLGLGGVRLMTVETWTVSVWGNGSSFVPLETYANSAITALHNQSAAGIFGCVHQSTSFEVDGDYRAVTLQFEIYTE